MKTVLVTGGAGFIGVNFVRALLAAEPDTRVVVLDKLTYAANRAAIDELMDEPRFAFVHADIADRAAVGGVLEAHEPDAIVHLAAETHVDRSITGPEDFVITNVVGTFRLLEEVRGYLAAQARPDFRFIHVSTDEVFGALGDDGLFDDASRYAPNSPYAASKAGSDHLARAYLATYGVPTIVTNCANNYGPFQAPEKLIPLTITRALAGEPLPVYGAGANVRDWIHVDDHCAALLAVLARGAVGATYLIGARDARRNLDVVHTICDELDALRSRSGGHRALVRFVTDRLGHDFRYAIDPSRIERELEWRPRIAFNDGIRATIRWYVDRVGG